MWVAKTKSNNVKVFLNKPVRWSINSIGNNTWVDTSGWDNGTAHGFPLENTELESSISWEDEPMEVNIVPIKELLEDQRELKDVYHKLINYQTAIIQLRNNMKTLDADMCKWIDENFLNLTIE